MLNRQINVETGTRNQRKKKGTADSNAISAQRSAFRSKKKKKAETKTIDEPLQRRKHTACREATWVESTSRNVERKRRAFMC